MTPFLLQKRALITRLLYILHLFLFLYLLTNQPLHLGRFFANLAVVIFCLTLYPGIIKRLKLTILKSPQIILMTYRRPLGISMYLFSLYHYLLSRLLPALKFNGSLINLHLAEIAGSLALFLLTPLFFTSNDWALKKLGKNWSKLHRLVYLIVWILVLHVTPKSGFSPITILLIGTAILKLTSFTPSHSKPRL